MVWLQLRQRTYYYFYSSDTDNISNRLTHWTHETVRCAVLYPQVDLQQYTRIQTECLTTLLTTCIKLVGFLLLSKLHGILCMALSPPIFVKSKIRLIVKFRRSAIVKFKIRFIKLFFRTLGKRLRATYCRKTAEVSLSLNDM